MATPCIFSSSAWSSPMSSQFSPEVEIWPEEFDTTRSSQTPGSDRDYNISRQRSNTIAVLLSRKQTSRSATVHDTMPLPSSFGGLFRKGVSDYPVLLCGLPGAGKSTLVNKWKTGDGSVPVTSNITIASIEVPGGAKITFRDIGLDDVEDRKTRLFYQCRSCCSRI